jgi:hypothetical protein
MAPGLGISRFRVYPVMGYLGFTYPGLVAGFECSAPTPAPVILVLDLSAGRADGAFRFRVQGSGLRV